MRFRDLLRRRQDAPATDEPREPFDRIVLIPGSNGSADLLSDSQSGEIHRILEIDGIRQIDAVPIVRRLLHRDIAARNVAAIPVESEHFIRQAPPAQRIAEHFLGAHFVLDERTRHAYRVFATPGCCVAERLWGDGIDEVHERPLGGALLTWCDLLDQRARDSLRLIEQAVPESNSWGLSFVSLQCKARSDIERRLFACSRGVLRFHTRPGVRGTEGAIEIEFQGRILRTFQEQAAIKVLGDLGEVPF